MGPSAAEQKGLQGLSGVVPTDDALVTHPARNHERHPSASLARLTLRCAGSRTHGGACPPATGRVAAPFTRRGSGRACHRDRPAVPSHQRRARPPSRRGRRRRSAADHMRGHAPRHRYRERRSGVAAAGVADPPAGSGASVSPAVIGQTAAIPKPWAVRLTTGLLYGAAPAGSCTDRHAHSRRGATHGTELRSRRFTLRNAFPLRLEPAGARERKSR